MGLCGIAFLFMHVLTLNCISISCTLVSWLRGALGSRLRTHGDALEATCAPLGHLGGATRARAREQIINHDVLWSFDVWSC